MGLSLGPHYGVGCVLRVGAVLRRDVGMTVGPHAGRISGTNRRRWVRPRIRYLIQEQRGRGRGEFDGTEQRERGASQNGYLASMWNKLLWKRLCCYSGAAVGRIVRITADTVLIIQIGTTLLTEVGGVVAISEFRVGGICWRQRGTTMDESL